MTWEKIKAWMFRHWKTVAAVALALVAAIVMGAICATPVGAPIVAALVTIKIFAVLSPIVMPFVIAGLTAAAVLATALLFNAATAVSNWLDKKLDKKGPGDAEYEYEPVDSAQAAERAAVRAAELAAQRDRVSQLRDPGYHSGPTSASHGHPDRYPTSSSSSQADTNLRSSLDFQG